MPSRDWKIDLENFPFRGKQNKHEELIEQLETQQDNLSDNLRRLESERDSWNRSRSRAAPGDRATTPFAQQKTVRR